MGLLEEIRTTSYYGRIDPNTKIKSVELNAGGDFDFRGLDRNLISSISIIPGGIENFIKIQTKQYDLFVLDELYKRGYDLLRLENSGCWRNTQPISANCERTQFYVDGVLVLTVRQTTRFENTDGKYMFYTDFDVED